MNREASRRLQSRYRAVYEPMFQAAGVASPSSRHSSGHLSSLHRMPRPHQHHESPVTSSLDEDPPVVGIYCSARIVNSPATDPRGLEDGHHGLEASPILLHELKVDPRSRIAWHAAIGVEVTSDVVQALGLPHQPPGIEGARQERRSSLEDPQSAVVPLAVDPTPMPEPLENCLQELQPTDIRLADPMRSLTSAERPVPERSLAVSGQRLGRKMVKPRKVSDHGLGRARIEHTTERFRL